MDGVQLLQVPHGLGVDMFAEVLRLETLALLSSRAMVEYCPRNLQYHPSIPRLGALTRLKMVLSAIREELLLGVAPSAADLFLLRGGKLDLRGNRLQGVAHIFLLKQALASRDGLDGIWLDGIGGGVAKGEHLFGDFEGVVGEVDWVALVVAFAEPVAVVMLLAAHRLVLVHVETRFCHSFQFIFITLHPPQGRKGRDRGYLLFCKREVEERRGRKGMSGDLRICGKQFILRDVMKQCCMKGIISFPFLSHQIKQELECLYQERRQSSLIPHLEYCITLVRKGIWFSPSDPPISSHQKNYQKHSG